ncbi:MAG: hypothetical protein NTX71_00335, partial [Candidatus Aureabacteria bacterium]|nr:hypothetical protein [Candidatus Auribacterota bacterium]
ALWGEKCVLGWRCYPLIHTIHKERKKEAKKERKAATTTSTFLFDATGRDRTYDLNIFPCNKLSIGEETNRTGLFPLCDERRHLRAVKWG